MINDAIHQTGTAYRSNNAGDGPERTRDHKYWFPRFKSNWLGTYRSTQKFVCCECAIFSMKRYKAVNEKHCGCGRDEWKRAKVIEREEYKARSDLSKCYGGIRYEEAIVCLKKEATNATKRNSFEGLMQESKVYGKKPKLIETTPWTTIRCGQNGPATMFHQLDSDMLPEREVHDVLNLLTDEESAETDDVDQEKKEGEFCDSFLDIKDTSSAVGDNLLDNLLLTMLNEA